MVLGGDPRQCVGLVAEPLEVILGDLAEDAGETARRVAILGQVGRLEKIAADLGTRCRGHLLDAHDKHDLGRTGTDGLDALMDGRGSRRTRVLDTGGRLEAECRVGLQHEARGEVLSRETGVEMAEHDLVDILGADPRILERAGRRGHDQALDGFVAVPTERQMVPANDTGRHDASSTSFIPLDKRQHRGGARQAQWPGRASGL